MLGLLNFSVTTYNWSKTWEHFAMAK